MQESALPCRVARMPTRTGPPRRAYKSDPSAHGPSTCSSSPCRQGPCHGKPSCSLPPCRTSRAGSKPPQRRPLAWSS
eukprot:1296631-Alexandrium_andersonii.AAC.1